MIEFYIGLSNGIKASLIITSVLIAATMTIGLRVKKLQTSDIPSGVTLVSIMFVEMVNNMIISVYDKKWKA